MITRKHCRFAQYVYLCLLSCTLPLLEQVEGGTYSRTYYLPTYLPTYSHFQTGGGGTYALTESRTALSNVRVITCR